MMSYHDARIVKRWRSIALPGMVLLLATSAIAASKPIGIVYDLTGHAWRGKSKAEIAAKTNRLTKGSSVYEKDYIYTGERAVLRIRFDGIGSRLTFGASTQVRVEQYLRSLRRRKSRKKSSIFELIKGKLRFITKKIFKQRVGLKIKTEHAVCGVRGTVGWAYQGPDKSIFANLTGDGSGRQDASLAVWPIGADGAFGGMPPSASGLYPGQMNLNTGEGKGAKSALTPFVVAQAYVLCENPQEKQFLMRLAVRAKARELEGIGPEDPDERKKLLNEAIGEYMDAIGEAMTWGWGRIDNREILRLRHSARSAAKQELGKSPAQRAAPRSPFLQRLAEIRALGDPCIRMCAIRSLYERRTLFTLRMLDLEEFLAVIVRTGGEAEAQAATLREGAAKAQQSGGTVVIPLPRHVGKTRLALMEISVDIGSRLVEFVQQEIKAKTLRKQGTAPVLPGRLRNLVSDFFRMKALHPHYLVRSTTVALPDPTPGAQRALLGECVAMVLDLRVNYPQEACTILRLVNGTISESMLSRLLDEAERRRKRLTIQEKELLKELLDTYRKMCELKY